MEPWIGASCATLLRPDENDDFAPLVYAMADWRKWPKVMAGGLRGFGLRWESEQKVALVFFLSETFWQLKWPVFIKNKGISRVVLIFAEEGWFRSKRSFSQQKDIFVAHFAAAKWGELCCEMALLCQEGASQLRKFSQRGPWGYEMISQQSGDFVEASFRLWNLADPCFTLFLAPNDFPLISLQFLLYEIIKKD